MSEIELIEKIPSQSLRMIIANCASNLVEFVSTWEEVKFNGLNEGFTVEELKAMVVSAVRKQLQEQGYKGYQVDNRIYNFIHAKERSLHNKEQYQKSLLKKRNVLNQKNYLDDDREQSHTHYGRDEFDKALDERIRQMSFNDNPQIFQMNKNDENYYDNLTPRDAVDLIKNSFSEEDFKNKELFIEIAWRVKNDRK